MINSNGNTLMVASGMMEEDTQKTRVSLTLSENFGEWMTLSQIAGLAGIRTESSVASRIRDLRADGSYIEKRLQANNPPGVRVFEYRYI